MTGADNAGSARSIGDLEELRTEIDRVDAALLRLIGERFAASESIALVKRPATGGTPIRPAREAIIMRGLLDSLPGRVDPDMIMRIWREILTASTLLQAPVRISVTRKAAADTGSTRVIGGHFPGVPVDVADDPDIAVVRVASEPMELAVMALSAPGLRPLMDNAPPLQVMGVLPFWGPPGLPRFVVLGHAPSERTGDDETLVATSGRLPRDFVPAPLWDSSIAGGFRITSLPGYLTESEMPLVGLKRNQALALTVLGRYPSPLVVP